MGKRKQSTEETKKIEVEDDSKAMDFDRYESDLVKLKIENQKTMNKSISKMESHVKQSISAKQVTSAIKALQKYFVSKQDKVSKSTKKNLLQDEDAYIHLNFTLSKLPTRPTPRPMQVKIPHSFLSEQHNSRICVFVKDPESDFRKQIEDLKIPCVAEVIGFDRLKRDFH